MVDVIAGRVQDTTVDELVEPAWVSYVMLSSTRTISMYLAAIDLGMVTMI